MMNTPRTLSIMYRIRPRRLEQSFKNNSKENLIRYFSASTTTDPSSTPSVTDRLRDQYNHRSQKFRNNLNERRQQLRETADQYRETGMSKYREFRENPQKTAVSGAKSFSAMVRTYGPVFVGTYFCVYVATLSSLYAGVASGVLDPVGLFTTMGIIASDSNNTMTSVDLVYQFMSTHDFSKPYAHYIQEYPPLANLGVAWIAVKFTEPVRLPLAITLTPRVARSIGYRVKTDDEETKQKDDATGKNESTSL